MSLHLFKFGSRYHAAVPVIPSHISEMRERTGKKVRTHELRLKQFNWPENEGKIIIISVKIIYEWCTV